MRYTWSNHDDDDGKMHIQRHNVSGIALDQALCGVPLRFNRSINAPFALGRKVCEQCLFEAKSDE